MVGLRRKDRSMLPDAYLEELKEVLKSRRLSGSSVKAMLSMTRRLGRAFDEEDLRDPQMLLMFRTPMVVGSRAILGMTWDMLRQTKVGADLPPLKRIPIVTYPHPLTADITILGACFGNESIGTITWGQAKAHWGWNERCLDAAGRAWWFFMPTDVMPTNDSPLVVKDNKARPMPLWLAEYIINSPFYVNKRRKDLQEAKLVRLAEKAINVAAYLQVDSDFMRYMCQRFEMVREKHRSLDTWVLDKELNDISRTKNHARLGLIIDALPVGKDPEVEEEPVDPIYKAMGLKGPPRGHAPTL